MDDNKPSQIDLVLHDLARIEETQQQIAVALNEKNKSMRADILRLEAKIDAVATQNEELRAVIDGLVESLRVVTEVAGRSNDKYWRKVNAGDRR